MVKNCITATCFVFGKDGVMFIKHRKLNTWLPPGGHVEANETPIEALHREVLEETGLRIELIDTYNLNHTERYIKDDHAEELIRPMTILLENVNSSNEPHRHFDLIYLAKLSNSNPSKAFEQHDTIWVRESEIDGLDMFDNVKELTYKVFEIIKALQP